jgi:hypothetical protein
MRYFSFLILALFALVNTRCIKEPDIDPNPTPTPTVPKPVPPRTQLLIGKTWQAMEVNDLSGCTNTHYVRGASGNTGANYNTLRFTFNADSTGSHTDTQGNTYPISWRFIAGDSSRMTITVNASTPVTYQWNMVDITANKLTETTAISTTPGNHILVSATFEPLTPVTVTPPSQTRRQMLIAKTWMVEEVYNNASCTNTHYLRGGSGNTGANYAVMRMTFNTNGTGSTTDTQGNTYPLTWSFTTPDERTLNINVNSGAAVYNWNQFEITPGVMYETTSIGTTSTNSVLVSSKMVHIP